MSLATRCPVCQTVFRVVQDQLKVSEGWVRCGRCAKVFNAFEGLFDLEREFPALRSPTPSQRVLEDLATRNRQPKPPPTWQEDFDTRAAVRDPSASTVPPHTSPHASPQMTPHVTSTSPAFASMVPGAAGATPIRRDGPPVATPMKIDPAPVAHDADATIWPGHPATTGAISNTQLPTQLSAPIPLRPSAPTPQTQAAELPAKAPPPVRPAVEIRADPLPLPGEPAIPARNDDAFEALYHSGGDAVGPVSTIDDVDIVLEGPDVEPASLDPDDAVDSRLLTFVQQADSAQRWRRPWVRTTLAVAAVVLVVLLAGQMLIAQRDLVVTRWPGSRALLQALCEPLGLRIEPLRRIDQISVDSSGLTRIDDGPIYRLVLVLRNRGEAALLVPAIDLSLTDASGALVTRRMLAAGELGASRTTIAAGQELPLQALLMSADRPLTGYTVEIFYP
jgi:predicted Zn finger-like uncharacterized protein